MSSATATQLIREVTGSHILGFFLVLMRVAPLFVVAPLFSAQQIPAQVKGVIAVAIAIGLTGVVTQGQQLPGDPLGVGALALEQILVGTAFALVLAAMFAALEIGGSFLDTVSGFAYGSLINPLTGTNSAVIARMYTMVGTMLFIAIGGDAYVLRGIARTFDLVPLGAAPKLDSLVGGVVSAFAAMFTAALEVAGPVLLALIVTDIAFGLVSRVVPQLNVFAVGLPVKVGVALLLVAASLPFFASWLTDALQNAVGLALRQV
jgi:flagellar biosynthetic protein FliR